MCWAGKFVCLLHSSHEVREIPLNWNYVECSIGTGVQCFLLYWRQLDRQPTSLTFLHSDILATLADHEPLSGSFAGTLGTKGLFKLWFQADGWITKVGSQWNTYINDP